MSSNLYINNSSALTFIFLPIISQDVISIMLKRSIIFLFIYMIQCYNDVLSCKKVKPKGELDFQTTAAFSFRSETIY